MSLIFDITLLNINYNDLSPAQLFNLQRTYTRIFTWFILPISESIQSFQIIGNIMNPELKSLVDPVVVNEEDTQYRFI